MERQTAIPSLISVSELDETLISTFNLTIQILDAVTSIIKIEGLKTEAKQKTLKSQGTRLQRPCVPEYF